MIHTLALEIDYAHEHAGWIDCDLIINEEHHRLDASGVFPPFKPLLYFVKAVAGQRFPAKFFWDEEGIGASFEATAVDEDSPMVHLKIKHDDSKLPWLDADIERETVIRAFLLPLLDVAQNYLVAEKEWEFPPRIADSMKVAILNGIPLRSEINVARPIEIKVKGSYRSGSLDGRVFIYVTVDDYPQLSFLLQDTSPFWQEWVDFLDKVVTGELPAQCEFLRINTFKHADQTVDEYRHITRFVAIAINHPHHFRLQIYTHWQDEDEFLLVDEVIDRRQCTQGFAFSMKKFLQEEYRLFPDNDGKTFDLRTLSLDKLV